MKKIDKQIKDFLYRNMYNHSKVIVNTNKGKKIVNDLIDVLINEIKTGQLNLKNLGSFKIKNKSERIGRNPKTKEEFVISARKTVKFTSSQKLLKSLNYE